MIEEIRRLKEDLSLKVAARLNCEEVVVQLKGVAGEEGVRDAEEGLHLQQKEFALLEARQDLDGMRLCRGGRGCFEIRAGCFRGGKGVPHR